MTDLGKLLVHVLWFIAGWVLAEWSILLGGFFIAGWKPELSHTPIPYVLPLFVPVGIAIFLWERSKVFALGAASKTIFLYLFYFSKL